MIGYIKDKGTFQTKCSFACLDYDVALCSIYDETSKITIKNIGGAQNGDFVYLQNGFAGVIYETEIRQGALVLYCKDVLDLFSRELFLPESISSVIEEFIREQIQSNFIGCGDARYAIPFMEAETLTNTVGPMAPDSEKGVFTLKEYMGKVRRLYNIFTEPVVLKDRLLIRIHRKPIVTHSIDLSDRSFDVLEETYSSKSTAKITAKAEDTGAVSDWYLLLDGSITNTYQTHNRANGNWDTLFIHQEEDIPERVAELFAKNTYSHLIEFRLPDSKMKYEFYDRLRIRTKSGLVLYSYVSGIRKTQATFTTIQSGELRVLLTDQNKELI